MTNKELKVLRKKYFKEGYKLARRKMLTENKGIDASEIEEIIDTPNYDHNLLKKWITILASRTDYNKIAYFTSTSTVSGNGASKYGFTCEVDTNNKSLVIRRISFMNENSRMFATISFNLDHPNGIIANKENYQSKVINLSKDTIHDVIRKINGINEKYAV